MAGKQIAVFSDGAREWAGLDDLEDEGDEALVDGDAARSPV